jgi:hypothetical protein
MALRIDFTNTGDSFEPLAKGVYNATIFNAEVREAKDSGQPYINWDFVIQGGDADGRHAWYMTSLQPQSLWKLKQNLVKIGVPAESLAGTFDLDLEALFGRPVRIVIDHETYQGSLRDRVVDMMGPDPETTSQPLFR